jgi:hypothetical protein
MRSDRRAAAAAGVVALAVAAVLAWLLLAGGGSTRRAPTALTATCVPTAVTVALPSTCTATVLDTSASGRRAPTGTVSFSSQGSGSFTPSTVCTLVAHGASSACSVSYSPSQATQQDISADYAGDKRHLPSQGATTVAATARSTALTLKCAPAKPPVGTAAACTVTVADTAAGTGAAPTGNVTVTATPSGTISPARGCTLAAVAAAASSTCRVHFTPSGTGAKLTAAYAGDPLHGAAVKTLAVSASKLPASVALACVPDRVAVAARSTCTATVTRSRATGGGRAPGGTVVFSAGAGSFSPSASCALAVASGSPSCHVTFVPAGAAGQRTLTAAYGGDATYDIGRRTITVTVTTRTVTATLTCSARTGAARRVTCTEKVADSDAGTRTAPTGTVTFKAAKSGSFAPGPTCTLAASGGAGTASCQVTFAAAASASRYAITADYPGDGVHAAATNAVSGSVG